MASILTFRRLPIFFMLLLAVGCGADDADVICERLAACGCLGETANECENRIEQADADDLQVCSECIAVHDYMCHEMVASHGACRRCTDRYATPGLGRDIMETGRVAGAEAIVMCVPGGGYPVGDGGVPDAG